MAILFGSQNGQAFLIYFKRCFKKMKKKRLPFGNLQFDVGVEGFEPPTLCL